MSVSNILKSVGIVLFGGVCGYNLVKFNNTTEGLQNRFIASVPMAKLGQEQIARSIFDIRVNLGKLALKDADASDVTVTLTAYKDIPAGLTYNWVLPDGVRLIEGVVSETVGAVASGESRTYTLKLAGFSKELKKYISFEVQGRINQFSVRRELLVSSRIEDSMEYLIQQSELKKENGKIKKLSGAQKAKTKFSAENIIR